MKDYIKTNSSTGRTALAGIIAAALGLAACTENVIEAPDAQATAARRTYDITTTLSPMSGSGTRSVLADPGDGTIVNDWAQGDSVWIIYYDSQNGRRELVAYVDEVDAETKAAEISFTLDDPNTRDYVVVYHPVDYWKDYFAADQSMHMRTDQKGTLDDINARWNHLMGYRKLTFNNDVATLVGGVDMEQENCIWKFTFTDGSRDITADIDMLTIRFDDGKGGYVTYNVAPDQALDVFYVAIRANDYAAVEIFAELKDGRTLTLYDAGADLVGGMAYTSLLTHLTPPDPDAPIDLAGKRIYEAKEGDVLTGHANERTHITIADGATVTLRDADITGLSDYESYAAAGIVCLGDATIILEGENHVEPADEVWPAINVPEGSTLTIKGDGTLIARSKPGRIFSQAAAIGGGYGISCGNIVIDGGTIQATARGVGGAGIGTGGQESNCGDIFINGGSVTAVGAERGAGIGSGQYCNGRNVTITGGEVHAIGGLGAAGIGPNWGHSFGDITISGGTVIAEGGDSSPGIGYRGPGGKILISGGDVHAIGSGTAAAIGGSSGLSEHESRFESIIITDGPSKVRATKGDLCLYFIGNGVTSGDMGNVLIDGISQPTPETTFPHFISELLTIGDIKTWSLLHK